MASAQSTGRSEAGKDLYMLSLTRQSQAGPRRGRDPGQGGQGALQLRAKSGEGLC